MVSLGPKSFGAPNFIGLSRDAATALADQWGLALDFQTIGTTSGTLVYSQNPGVGVTVIVRRHDHVVHGVRIGAHVRRRSGGIAGAVEECRLRGADAAQIFVSNPRGWAGPRVTDEEAEAFRESWAASGLGPLVAHAPYLVNIASPNKEFIAKSRGLAGSTVRACDALAIDFLVLHAGAGGPRSRRRRASGPRRRCGSPRTTPSTFGSWWS